MGSPSYMLSVVDRNVVMRRMPVLAAELRAVSADRQIVKHERGVSLVPLSGLDQ